MDEFAHLDPEASALWRALTTMSSQLGLALDRQLKRDAGISQADYQVIQVLAEAASGQLRPGELGELLGWEKSRVSHQLARMEGRSLISRESCDSDARGTWVSLSDEGRRALVDAGREHAAAIMEMFFKDLSEQERVVLRATADRVIDRLNPVACEIAAANGMRARRPTAVR